MFEIALAVGAIIAILLLLLQTMNLEGRETALLFSL
jgi:uncharacterized integral membrane protein